MKKTAIYLHLTITALFSYLFYNQGVGLNLGVFTVLLLIGLGIAYKSQVKKRQWQAAALLCVATALSVSFNASPLNVLLNLLAILVLIYVCVHERLSVISGGFFAGLSVFSGLWISLADKFLSLNTSQEKEPPKSNWKWTYFILPIVVLFLFFMLYRNASEGFADLTNQIDLSFISPAWIAFTLFGYFILYGAFKTPAELNFLTREINYDNVLQKETNANKFGFYQTGILLFYLLNALLLIVVITDFIFLATTTPETRNMSHSEIIHQGIDSLIFSLILAVLFILLWFHRGNPNPTINKHLTIGALVWASLNACLIVANVYKNTLYIDAHGLTYKRIGVYFALLLALTVIVTCIYKVMRHKNNWFMYRSFGMSLLVIGLGFNCLNWDKIITKYNIALYASGKTTPDVAYMLNLSPDCLPLIYKNWDMLNVSKNNVHTALLEDRIEKFRTQFLNQDWRSNSINAYSTYAKLKHISLTGKYKNLIYPDYSRID